MQIGIQPRTHCRSRPDREYIKTNLASLIIPKYDPWILSHSIPMQIGIQSQPPCHSRPDREYIKTNLASLIIPEIRSMGFSPLHPDGKSGSSRGPIVVPDLIGNTSKPTLPHLSSPKYDPWILSHSIPMQIGIQSQPPVIPDLIGNTSNQPCPHLSSPKYDPWILSHSIPMQIGIQSRPLIVFLESAFGGRNTCNLCFGVCLFITKTNKPQGFLTPTGFISLFRTLLIYGAVKVQWM